MNSKHLLIIILFTLCPPIYAQTIIGRGTIEGTNLTWQIDGNGTLTIGGTGDMPDFAGENPPWHELSLRITSAAIGSGVTKVGNYAFWNCSELTSAYIPSSTTSIGAGAFWINLQQASHSRPNSVTTIGNGSRLMSPFFYNRSVGHHSYRTRSLRRAHGITLR